MNNLLIIGGCGAVASCLLEMMKLQKINLKKITIVDPAELKLWVREMYPQIEHIQISLEKDNMRRVLVPHLKSKPSVCDLSIDVDSIELMKICRIYKCTYINTSIEAYEEGDPSKLDPDQDKLLKRTLMYQNELARKTLKSSETTMLILAGQNPGYISYSALCGVRDYCLKHGTSTEKNLLKEKKWGELAQSLGLKKIHISEIDTQVIKKDFQYPLGKMKGNGCAFYNTWSAFGLEYEALDPVQISDKVYNARGMDTFDKSAVVNNLGKTVEFTGIMIPHGESYTLSSFFQCGDYKPIVYYVYSPPECAQIGLHMIKKRDYKPIPKERCYVLQLEDIARGYDSVGCLLFFEKDNKIRHWWSGSILTVAEVRKKKFKHSGPTVVQVAINFLQSLLWITKHKKEGLIEPEDLPFEMMLNKCRKYLGQVVSKEVKLK